MNPKVSVLMTAYNRPDLIRHGIESFLRQTYPNAELLICDDCSTDNTLDVIKEYAARHATIKWYQNKENKKFLPTINWLFSIAEGDYICICDSDDEMAADRIEHQLNVLNRYHADAVISELAKIDKFGSLISNVPKSIMPVQILPDSEEVQLPSGSLFMHRRVIQKVKGYNPYFADAFCGDIYLINTIASLFKLVYDPKPVYYYRLTEGSMTQTFNLYQLSKLELSKFLIRQRHETGTDFLEQQNFEALEKKRLQILNNKKWQSEQYRLYAARAIDENNYSQAATLLKQAYANNLLSFLNLQTLVYYFKKRLHYSKRHTHIKVA